MTGARDKNCYYTIPTTPIMELLEGKDEILNTTRPPVVGFSEKCMKAAIGRGFSVAVIYLKQCYGGDRRELFTQNLYNCGVLGGGCTQNQAHGLPCERHGAYCYCGDGYGSSSSYLNMYDTASKTCFIRRSFCVLILIACRLVYGEFNFLPIFFDKIWVFLRLSSNENIEDSRRKSNPKSNGNLQLWGRDATISAVIACRLVYGEFDFLSKSLELHRLWIVFLNGKMPGNSKRIA